MWYEKKWKWKCQLPSHVQPPGLQPSRLLYLWNSPGKNNRLDCDILLQGIFPIQGSKPGLPHCKQIDFLPFELLCIGEEMATHSSVLAWRIPGTGEPGGLPSMGSHRVRHDWGDLAEAARIFAWRIPWTEEPGGLQFMGSQRVRHDWGLSLSRKETQVGFFRGRNSEALVPS